MSDRLPEDDSASFQPSGPNRQRRQFLSGISTVVAVLAAGCSGGGGSGDSSSMDDTESTDSDTTPADSGTDTESDPDSEKLKTRAREFIQLQANGSFEAAHDRLSESLTAEFSITDLTQAWQQIATGRAGFRSIDEVEYVDTTDGLSRVTVAVNFNDVQTTFTIEIDSSNAIANYNLTEQSEYDWDPPTYADQSAFSDTTVTLTATNNCNLDGTLLVPAEGDSVPGAVVVHGSGPNDRDGTHGPNRPYKELAWGLVSRGIAVLRYDKRTFACADTIDPTALTIDDAVTDDVLTASDRLKEHDRVARDNVFVVGHSLGGQLTPRVLTRDSALAGGVMLAPLARPFADAILAQRRHLLEQQDLSEQKRQTKLAEIQAIAEKIRTLEIGDNETVLGAGRPYYRTLAEYDGPQTAVNIERPLFLAQGGRDYQVTIKDDLSIWQAALTDRAAVTTKIYDDLNHLFQQSTGPMTSDEYYTPGAVFDRRVVRDITEFIKSHS